MPLRWEEGWVAVSGIMKELATKITDNALDLTWTLHYPITIAEILDVFTIKKTVGTNTVFIEFNQEAMISVTPRAGGVAVEKPNYYSIECKFGTGYTSPVLTGVGTWVEDQDSPRARFSWFMSDTETVIKSWLPVQYWISVDENRIAMILSGDASANYNDRLISFGYFGSVKSFDGAPVVDVDNNFGMNVSSDASPFDYLTEEELTQYSDKTATLVVDIGMLKTVSGFPMQAHYAAFTSPDEFVYKQLEGPSRYTNKYHMSPIYVFHGFDGYRGDLNGVVASDKSTIVHLDEMIHTVGTNKNIYKVFAVNAPFSIFSGSTNVLYAIAILKEIQLVV